MAIRAMNTKMVSIQLRTWKMSDGKEQRRRRGEGSRYGDETLNNVAAVKIGGAAGLLVGESSEGGSSNEKEDLRGGRDRLAEVESPEPSGDDVRRQWQGRRGD